jgi:5-methylcytosine-specific restriction endonuclease McrA
MDLLSDLPYLDKHQYVDKLVEQHLLVSGELPRPLSLTQASTSFMPALVLNADYQPLSFTPLSLWSWQDAIKAVFRGKVTVVDVYDNVKIRGVNVEVPLPSVIALNEYVSNHKSVPAFTKRNVFLRDEYKCQYCNGQFFSQNDLSIDHVHPRCKGGRLHWENAVVRKWLARFDGRVLNEWRLNLCHWFPRLLSKLGQTSCRNCNGRKGSLGVTELESVGMRLLRPPKVPSQYELSRIASRLWLPRRKVHPTWQPYLEQYFEQS